MNNEQLIKEAGEVDETEVDSFGNPIIKDDPNEDDNGYDQVAQDK